MAELKREYAGWTSVAVDTTKSIRTNARVVCLKLDDDGFLFTVAESAELRKLLEHAEAEASRSKYKVGDKISTEANYQALPVKAVVVDEHDGVWQKSHVNSWRLPGRGGDITDARMVTMAASVTLVYLPEG